MADTTSKTTTKATTAKGAPATDGGAAQLQAIVDEAEQKGYLGEVPDPTPNRNYTVAGVLEGAETPENADDRAQAGSR
jgi:hypothetical protein